MKLFKLERSQLLRTDLWRAWEFFSTPANLARITPAWLDFNVTSEPPDKIQAGLIITYTVRPLFGLAVNWVTEITHLQAPHYFVDEQRFGPYRFWHHQHHFTETAEGVLMRDIVHYGFKVPILQQLQNRLIVEPKLNDIFDQRAEITAEILAKP